MAGDPTDLSWWFGGDATKGMANGPQTGDYQRSYLQQMLGRNAPQMNDAQSNQDRAQQGQLANILMGVATGNQAGPGELAVQRQVGNAMGQQTAQASMARGADAALAARSAMRNQADIGVNGAGQAGIAQMQDKMNAGSQLSQILGTMRGQDIGVAQGNQSSQLQQQQQQLGMLAQLLGVDQTQLAQDLAKRNLGLKDQGMFPGLLQQYGQMAAGMAATAGKAAAGGA